MNFLRTIVYFVGNLFKDGYQIGDDTLDEAKESVVNTGRIVFLAFVAAILCLFGGVGLAALGFVTAGKVVIYVSGLLSVLLFTLFNARALFAGYVVMLVSKFLHGVTSKVPVLEQAKVDSILSWARGITLWVMMLAFYAMLFPVWENMGRFVIVVVAAILIATMVSAWQQSGALFRWVAFWGTMSVLVWSTFQFVAPDTSLKIKETVDYYAIRVQGTGLRTMKLAEVEHQAKAKDATQDAALLKKIRNQQAAIRLKAVNDPKCFGLICEKADEETYGKLELAAKEIMSRLPKQPEADPKSGSGSANLAPPMTAPVANPAGKTPVVGSTTASAKSGPLTAADIDEAFASLEQ